MRTVNTGGTFLDCAYHYYLDGDSIVEVRNGSNLTLKQQVWGLQYVDELLQTSINTDLSADNTCESLYWVCQDANYNVLGLVDGSGVLSERYEYKPYGERLVLISAGSNDPDLMAPTLLSRRVPLAAGVNQPEGLCEFGHQGLYHDEELGLIYNRARALHPQQGRFLQRDPTDYADGASLYEDERSSPPNLLDPAGLAANPDDFSPGLPYPTGIGFGGQPYYIQGNTTVFVKGKDYSDNPLEAKSCSASPTTLKLMMPIDGSPNPLIGKKSVANMKLILAFTGGAPIDLKIRWWTCARDPQTPGVTTAKESGVMPVFNNSLSATLNMANPPYYTETQVSYLSCECGTLKLYKFVSAVTYHLKGAWTPEFGKPDHTAVW